MCIPIYSIPDMRAPLGAVDDILLKWLEVANVMNVFSKGSRELMNF